MKITTKEQATLISQRVLRHLKDSGLNHVACTPSITAEGRLHIKFFDYEKSFLPQFTLHYSPHTGTVLTGAWHEQEFKWVVRREMKNLHPLDAQHWASAALREIRRELAK